MVTRMNDDLVVLGKMSADERAQKLMELGELRDLAGIADDETLQSGFELKDLFSPGPRAWEHATHAFGFLAETDGAGDLVPLQDATTLAPDATLAGSRIDLGLDRVRFSDYPGRGTHRVLFDVQARSVRDGAAEELHYPVAVRAREGASAAMIEAPVFVGLGVGAEGVALRCVTVNVKNDDDEGLFASLEAATSRRGLALLATPQPAAGLMGALVSNIVRALARRHRNAALQDIALGLDLGGPATAARLRLGTYFAVQAPPEVIATCWQDWLYHRPTGFLVARSVPTKPLPYNYVAFTVRRHAA